MWVEYWVAHSVAYLAVVSAFRLVEKRVDLSVAESAVVMVVGWAVH